MKRLGKCDDNPVVPNAASVDAMMTAEDEWVLRQDAFFPNTICAVQEETFADRVGIVR